MKLILNIVNILTILSSIAWGGFIYFESLSKAFSSASGTNYFATLPGYVSWSPLLVSIFFVILSRIIENNKIGIILAIIPFVWIFFCYFILSGVKNKYNLEINKSYEEYAKNSTMLVEKMAVFSHDYICKEKPKSAYKVLDEFFTYNKENNTIVHINVSVGEKYASPLGKINGDTLELFYDLKQSDMPDCRDANGKTIFDNYKVVYKPNQKIEDYNIEKYGISE